MEQPKKKWTVRAFRSFEEAQAYEDEFAAQQDPLERMALTVGLIKRVFDYKPRTPDMPRTFTLRRLF